MIPVNITLTFVRDNSKESRRIKLSLTDQIGDVIDQLVGELGLAAADNSGRYVLIHNKQALDDADTLQMAGVQEGDIVQLSFMDKNATMGQAVSMALLNRTPNPTESQARYWLAGNLCRCTGYDKIIKAVLDTAEEMRSVPA